MYIEQAYKGNNIIWRVVLTSFITTGIFVVNMIAYLFMTKSEMQQAYDLMKKIPNWLSLIVNLIPFALLLGVLFFLVHFLHERSILSLTTSRKKIDFKRFIFSFSLIVIISLVSFSFSYYKNHEDLVLNFHLGKFLILFFTSVILLPFQIGFEEFLFRGFLMQQIGIIAKNRWTALLITSVFFGLFHSANPEVAEMGFGVMIFYIGTGFLLGIMTLMDEGLELSLGFHFGNNLLAALLVTTDYSALQTDAIFKDISAQNTSDMLLEMIVSMAVTYPILLFILSKKYNWTNWKEKLTGKIQEPISLSN
jgi:uncharacterized protein